MNGSSCFRVYYDSTFPSFCTRLPIKKKKKSRFIIQKVLKLPKRLLSESFNSNNYRVSRIKNQLPPFLHTNLSYHQSQSAKPTLREIRELPRESHVHKRSIMIIFTSRSSHFPIINIILKIFKSKLFRSLIDGRKSP